MKRKIIAAVATVFCLCFGSFAAFAGSDSDKPDGWYVKGAYENYFGNRIKSFAINRNTSAFGASLGYKSGYLRADGKYSFASPSHGSLHNLSLNGYVDFDNSTIFSPYVGLGLGKTFAHYHGHTTSFDLYPSGTLGTRAYITNNLALDVGYQTNLRHTREGAATLGLAYHF